MTHFSDPEMFKIKDSRKREFDRMWRKGEILDNTYLRSLFILGFLPDEANTELNMLKMEKTRFEVKCSCGRSMVGGAIACGGCYAEARERAEKARQALREKR